jgi:uncharacterized membrane protein YfcA
VYLATQGSAIASVWRFVGIATIGAVIGTVLGTRVLGHLPPRAFRHVIGVLLVVLGVYMIVVGVR